MSTEKLSLDEITRLTAIGTLKWRNTVRFVEREKYVSSLPESSSELVLQAEKWGTHWASGENWSLSITNAGQTETLARYVYLHDDMRGEHSEVESGDKRLKELIVLVRVNYS